MDGMVDITPLNANLSRSNHGGVDAPLCEGAAYRAMTTPHPIATPAASTHRGNTVPAPGLTASVSSNGRQRATICGDDGVSCLEGVVKAEPKARGQGGRGGRGRGAEGEGRSNRQAGPVASLD